MNPRPLFGGVYHKRPGGTGFSFRCQRFLKRNVKIQLSGEREGARERGREL